jgi:hypothetical protein
MLLRAFEDRFYKGGILTHFTPMLHYESVAT